MKVAILIFIYFFTSDTKAITLKKVEGIDDFVHNVNFDSDGNTYAGIYDYGSRREIYKISPSKEIIWKIEYPKELGTIWDSRVTSHGGLYLEFFNSDTELVHLAVIQPDSTGIQVVEDDFVDFVFAKDGSDDLVYLKPDGIYFLRLNSTTPIPVTNLQNTWVYGSETVDVSKSGDLYIGILSGFVAVISNEAQQEEIPSATFISDSNPTGFFIQDIAVDGDDNLWTVSTNGLVTNFKKLKNDALEIVATKEIDRVHHLVPAQDKIFVYAYSTDDKNASIFYLNLNGDIVGIPELENINLGSYLEDNGVADSEGNAYFHATRDVISESLGPLVLVSSDGKVTSIDVDVSNSFIDFVRLDFNDDLWVKREISVFENDLYRLKKGETVLEKVNIPVESQCNNFIRDITPNPVTKDIFVQCVDGLYVVVED